MRYKEIYNVYHTFANHKTENIVHIDNELTLCNPNKPKNLNALVQNSSE